MFSFAPRNRDGWRRSDVGGVSLGGTRRQFRLHERTEHGGRLAVPFLKCVGVQLECCGGVGVTEAAGDDDRILAGGDQLRCAVKWRRS
jgi:hypothetical protein